MVTWTKEDQEATLIPMPGMLRERGWSRAELNLTVRCIMHLEQIAWPQATVFDAYAVLGRMVEDGGIETLERVRDTAVWETLPTIRAVPIGHPF